jgi:hypothetical protein
MVNSVVGFFLPTAGWLANCQRKHVTVSIAKVSYPTGSLFSQYTKFHCVKWIRVPDHFVDFLGIALSAEGFVSSRGALIVSSLVEFNRDCRKNCWLLGRDHVANIINGCRPQAPSTKKNHSQLASCATTLRKSESYRY